MGGSPLNINESKTIRSPLMDAVAPEMGEGRGVGFCWGFPTETSPNIMGDFQKIMEFSSFVVEISDP